MVKRRAFGMEPASGVALDEHHIQRRDDSCSSDYRAEYVPCRAIVDAAGFGSTKEIHSVQLTPLGNPFEGVFRGTSDGRNGKDSGRLGRVN